MEVTSVSPSATSPTEWDDLCVIDGSNVAIHSVTLLISLCGLVGNGAVFWLFQKYFFILHIYEMVFADVLFLLFAIPSALLFLVEDLSCTSIVPLLYLSFLFQMSRVCCYWPLVFVFRVGASDLIEKLHDHLSGDSDPPSWLRYLLNSIHSCATFALFAVIPTVTSRCPSHEQEHCKAALISMHTFILLVFVVPMVISHTIDLIQSMRGLRVHTPEFYDISILLVMLLIFLLSLFNFLQQLGYIIVSSQTSFLLTCIYSSIKPFIYFLDGRCWTLCSAGFRWISQRIIKWREERPFFHRRSLQKNLDGLKKTLFTMDSHRLSLQRILDGLQKKPFSMKSLYRSLKSILDGLQESLESIDELDFYLRKSLDRLEGKPFFMESHRLSLQRILDGLDENYSSIDSLQDSLQRILDGLKGKPFFEKRFSFSLQRTLDEPEENTARRNDAPKDMRV